MGHHLLNPERDTVYHFVVNLSGADELIFIRNRTIRLMMLVIPMR